MKKIITFIICIILLISNNMVYALNNETEPENTKPIVNKITSYDILTTGIIVALNDHDAFNDFVENKNKVYIAGYNDDDTADARVIIDNIDISNVNLNVAGIYPVYLNLRLDDVCVDDYILDEGIKTVTFSVCVSDPNNFDIFIMSDNASNITFSWLKRKQNETTVFYIESDIKLTYQDLQNKSWQILDDTIVSNFFRLSQTKLELNKYYYFYFQNGQDASEIIQYYKDHDKPVYENIGGDRDAGDSKNPPLPEIEQPAPVPEESENNTASVNENQSLDNNEYFGNDKDILSGYRISLMQENSYHSLKFSKHGITISIPSSTIADLKLQDSDLVEIDINKVDDYSFSFEIKINNQKIDKLNNMKVMFPCSLKDNVTEIEIINNDSNYNGTYDSKLQVVTFETDYPGLYQITHLQEKTTPNYLPYILFLIVVIGFIIIKRGIKNVKQIS